jgi:hypothetical protein
VRDADAAGFSRQELAAAYTSLMAETSENNCWKLDAGKRAFWRNYALLNDTKPAFAAQPPAPMKVAIATAPPKPSLSASQHPNPLPTAVASPRTEVEETEAAVVARIMNAGKAAGLKTPAGGAIPTARSLPHAEASETVDAVVARIMGAGKAPPSAGKQHETRTELFARRRREATQAVAAGPTTQASGDVYARRAREAGHKG